MCSGVLFPQCELRSVELAARRLGTGRLAGSAPARQLVISGHWNTADVLMGPGLGSLNFT